MESGDKICRFPLLNLLTRTVGEELQTSTVFCEAGTDPDPSARGRV